MNHEPFPLPMTVPALRVPAPACGPKRSAPRWHPKVPWSWPCHKRLPGCFLGQGAWEIWEWRMAHLTLKHAETSGNMMIGTWDIHRYSHIPLMMPFPHIFVGEYGSINSSIFLYFLLGTPMPTICWTKLSKDFHTGHHVGDVLFKKIQGVSKGDWLMVSHNSACPSEIWDDNSKWLRFY